MTQIVSREEALLAAAKKLDISPTKYRQAIDRFNLMRTHLEQGNYLGTSRVPEVYLQGSFKLGTEIRPFKNSKDADYDIDLVCNLGHSKQEVLASTVKNQVGQRIKENGTYARLLDDEGKRCWTLNYAVEDGVGFHMDVLPSVKGFAEWFYEKNGVAFDREKLIQKQQVFNSQRNLYNSVDDVPNIHVKTPLQRTIQLLKRHRDVRFSQSEIEDYKPISMVISVLAAQCYQNETTIYDTLKSMISILSQHSHQMSKSFVFNDYYAKNTYTQITRTSDGKWIIPNPTNPGENFADRWHEDNNARANAFFQWVTWLREDFSNIETYIEEDRFTKSLVDIYKPTNLPALSFNMPYKEKLSYPIVVNGYSADIKASYKTGSSSWKRFESGQILLKNKELKFNLKTNVPPPFDIYWQVVNTGQEAADAGQLRGEISPQSNTTSNEIYRTESTSYTGDHWVECFVIKNDKCFAKTGEFIVSIRDTY
jgi:hypothetical protein